MPEEVENPDETVLKRLRETGAEDDTRNLRSYVVGGVEASQLDYEDWVRPLKLTGGRVCLRVDWHRLDGVSWVRRRKDGHLEAWDSKGDDPYEIPVSGMKHMLDSRKATVTPVPVEATPFAEDTDRDD